MDRPRQNDHLGVNKIGRNIRKSPLHQPSFNANANNNNAAAARPQPQPQVYNISKNDFRSIVQQLTGSPSRESLPRPPPPPPQNNNSPKPQNTRLHRIRPAPLTQLNRPQVPVPLPAMAPQPHHPHLVRPAQPQPPQQLIMGQGDQFWSNTAESPVSEYMRYLQSSLGESSGPNSNQMQPSHEHRPYMPPSQPHQHMPPSQPHQPMMPPQPHQHMMPPQPHQPRVNMQQGPLQPNQYLPPPGLVPSPLPRNLPSPRFNGPVPVTPTLPSPRFNHLNGNFPSPQYNGFGPLHSPTSQFLLQSPTGYANMFSPRSPYPLLSPGVQYPPPLTPNFSFPHMAQPGPSARPGPGPPQPPPSPGLMFPVSPSGYFPMPSPRWSDY